MSETQNKLRYFTLLIAWNDRDTEEGEFGWAGWAADSKEAERFAREEMAESDNYADGLAEREYGHVIDCTEGAACYQAPRAADALAKLLEDGPGPYTAAEVQAVLDILRPPAPKETA
jgi:hypothetical protein